jgi:hypothetical protein
MNFIATLQIIGDTPKDIADELRILAKQIETQGTMEIHEPSGLVVYVREYTSGGEEPLDAGKRWAVGQSEMDPGDYVALFANKEHAERLVEGAPIFDDEDGPMTDLCVTRARVVGTFWNSFDPDPEDANGKT